MQETAINAMTTVVLTINGERKELRARTLRAMLTELELEGEFFAIAVNRKVVTKTRWNENILQDGDTVEIVTPRQGG